MPHLFYDSFGDPLPQAQGPKDAPPHVTQRSVLLAGTGLFWTLVVIILSARILYFDDAASTFAQFAAASRAFFGG